MIYRKGRWQASYKDTFSLDMTLSPIIYAGLKRFHDALEQKNREGKCIGIPSGYCANPDIDVTDQGTKLARRHQEDDACFREQRA